MWKWTQQPRHTGTNGTSYQTVKGHSFSFTENLGEYSWGEKISTNLKYQLLEHTTGQAAWAYWSGKTCFQGIDIQQVDWSMVETVLKNQTISMHRWMVKFATGFYATGSQMIYDKQWKIAECPCCRHPQETMAHILQCPNAESQTLWDDSILQL